MLVLGIDPGTATTGYGLVGLNKGVAELLTHGLIETDKDGPPGSRLVKIYKETSALLKKHKPTVVAIERIFFFINKNYWKQQL